LEGGETNTLWNSEDSIYFPWGRRQADRQKDGLTDRRLDKEMDRQTEG
jgi:hypothetical protein